ncbi:MAG: ATP-dependent zinc protease [Candidatus Andersenbacteria bacterium]|nr:ATP-dependent zinc protease [Candidatus Andersenbacteria bacterium]MBI3250769.1 ATP-dependent zinc protease [Candidatus Andersenbacteria bacterium]
MFLKEWKGVLGMNARVVEYINKSNSPEAIRLANNKLATKKALHRLGLSTPRLYATLSSRQELRRFRWTKLPASFVLKPSSSYGGGGVVVIFGRNKKGEWVKADKTAVFIPELRRHVMDILDGDFSSGNVPDTALFEQRVKIDQVLKPLSIKGIPDIRLLIYNGVPVMAMLRLATEESGGRANLHAGGIGVGIDLSLGITTTAIHHGKLIDTLPGKRQPIAGVRIPYWNDILHLSVRAAQAIGLSYAGVDIAIDRDDGPMVLEINARPGLEIQVANLAPLRLRLRRVEGLPPSSVEKKIRLAKELFGAELEHEIEELSGRMVLGVEETVEIIDSHGETIKVAAKVDTGAWRTAIDQKLAEKLGLSSEVLEHRHVQSALGEQVRPVIKLTMKVRGQKITTEAFIADRKNLTYDMILGRRDLRGFLVDPAKRSKNENTYP